MQIEINTGHFIEGHEALAAQVRGIVESALSRFSDQTKRVEVHLRDENSDKNVDHDTIRWMMEDRLEGRQPSAVTHRAAALAEAVAVAADKLAGMIESIHGRLREQQSHRTDPGPSTPEPQLEDEA